MQLLDKKPGIQVIHEVVTCLLEENAPFQTLYYIKEQKFYNIILNSFMEILASYHIIVKTVHTLILSILNY